MNIENYNYDEYESGLEKLKSDNQVQTIKDIPKQQVMDYCQQNKFSVPIVTFVLNYITSIKPADIGLGEINMELLQILEAVKDFQKEISSNKNLSLLFVPQYKVPNFYCGYIIQIKPTKIFWSINGDPKFISKFSDYQLVKINVNITNQFNDISYIFIKKILSKDADIMQISQRLEEYSDFVRWMLIKQYLIENKIDLNDNLLNQIDITSQSVRDQRRLLAKSQTKQQNSQQHQQSIKLSSIKESADRNQMDSVKEGPSSQNKLSNRILNSDVMKSINNVQKQQPKQSNAASYVDLSKNNISRIDSTNFKDILQKMKTDVLQKSQQNEQSHYFDNRQQFYGAQKIGDLVEIKLDSLEKMMKDYVASKQKRIDLNPQQDLQYLLSYYHQNQDFESYGLLMQQYSDVIHKQLFEKMGLGNVQFNPPQPRKETATQVSFNRLHKGQIPAQFNHFNESKRY